MAIYWISFIIFSIGHLTACHYGHAPSRNITKALIIPFLMLGLILTDTYEGLLFAGLFFGWLGDVFLLKMNKKGSFAAGIISFALGHFSYIAAALIPFFKNNGFADIPLYIYFIVVCAAVFFLWLARHILPKKLGTVAYLGALYFTVLISAISVSILTGRYLLALAFVIFTVSDSLLAAGICEIKIKNSGVYVMATYITAQALICISFIIN